MACRTQALHSVIEVFVIARPTGGLEDHSQAKPMRGAMLPVCDNSGKPSDFEPSCKLRVDEELFEKAYSHIRQYYEGGGG
jgi:hypothetical protein